MYLFGIQLVYIHNIINTATNKSTAAKKRILILSFKQHTLGGVLSTQSSHVGA